jgi:type IV secretion system protein VirB10
MTHDATDPRDREPSVRADADADANGNTISPLPGEPGIPNVATRQRVSMSKKGLLAVLLLVGSLVAVAAFTIQRFSASGKKADEESKLVKDKPTAATSEPRRLEMPPAPTASAAVAASPRIPALTPTADDLAEPIGVRRTGSGAPASGGPKVVPPEDAPVMLRTRRRVPPPEGRMPLPPLRRASLHPSPLTRTIRLRQPRATCRATSASCRACWRA